MGYTRPEKIAASSTAIRNGRTITRNRIVMPTVRIRRNDLRRRSSDRTSGSGVMRGNFGGRSRIRHVSTSNAPSVVWYGRGASREDRRSGRSEPPAAHEIVNGDTIPSARCGMWDVGSRTKQSAT